MDTTDVLMVMDDKPRFGGYMYTVFQDGICLLRSSDPEYDTCRKLRDSGHTGLVRFWMPGKPVHNSSLDIERGAKFRSHESRRAGICVHRYQPMPSDLKFRLRNDT